MTPSASNLLDLNGKVALVTGAAGGIGAGIASVLAAIGATVVIADRDSSGALREVSTVTRAGGKAGHVHIDLADEESIVRGCGEVIATYGTPFALVNNAECRTASSCWRAAQHIGIE